MKNSVMQNLFTSDKSRSITGAPHNVNSLFAFGMSILSGKKMDTADQSGVSIVLRRLYWLGQQLSFCYFAFAGRFNLARVISFASPFSAGKTTSGFPFANGRVRHAKNLSHRG